MYYKTMCEMWSTGEAFGYRVVFFSVLIGLMIFRRLCQGRRGLKNAYMVWEVQVTELSCFLESGFSHSEFYMCM